MSTTAAALTVAAILAFGLPAAYWQIRRAQQTCDDVRAQVIAQGRIRGSFAPTVHDVGPDALRLLEDLDAHLDQHFIALSGLYERVGPPSPDLAGLERLRQAVRDEQNGEQA